jgi:microcystin-dependent protein
MSTPFVAEIRLFALDFPPVGWARCDGQLLPISQNTALFSLLGTTYGGDGKSTFALPNLQGNSPMHAGGGPGLSERYLGETNGSSTVTLQSAEIPSHTHGLKHGGAGVSGNPGLSSVLGQSGAAQIYTTASAPADKVAAAILETVGGAPHNNRQPYLALNFCIALQGVFPPRW